MVADTRLTANASKSCGESGPLACLPQGCPCGYYTDPRKECHCTSRQVRQYLSRISGPLLDRIDIQLEVPAVAAKELRSERDGDDSTTLRAAVLAARDIQSRRFAPTTRRSSDQERGGVGGRPSLSCPSTPLRVYNNARMTGRMLRKHCALTSEAEAILNSAMDSFALSARAHGKILNA